MSLWTNDKTLHFLFNLGVVVGFAAVGQLILGVVLAVIASVGKEVIDYYFGGTCSKKDLAADIIGISLGVIFGVII